MHDVDGRAIASLFDGMEKAIGWRTFPDREPAAHPEVIRSIFFCKRITSAGLRKFLAFSETYREPHETFHRDLRIVLVDACGMTGKDK
jgi:hypothetical protein